ncbi:MAG TPA: lipoprotein-releasing ABC transporter permease subunit [Alphaproteobacteria bacterium]|nr:lipoprotein-releasing ABC transporter permease subunit [Alphaproteobacteria bacterium]
MTFGPFERLLAARYLRARGEGFVSVIAGFSLLGIALGVATLIIVMSVMTGFRTEFVHDVLGVSPHIRVSTTGPVENYEDLVTQLAKLPHVTSVVPSVEGNVLFTKYGYGSLLQIIGIREKDLAAKPIFAKNLVRGSMADFTDDKIAIGVRLAERFNLNVGDQMTLISPKVTSTPFGSMPRRGTFEIGLIFNVGMYDVDSGAVVMPLEAAQQFLQTGSGVSELDVMIEQPEEGLAEVEHEIASTLGPQYRILDWMQQNFAYLNALVTERTTMFIILVLLIVVAAFNIISGLIMLVKDKGADIAILRTMGATRGMIMRVFFMIGATIGTVGSATGVLIGVLFVRNIEGIRQLVQKITGTNVFDPSLYIFSQIPAKISWGQVSYIVAIALALSFLASILPAWRASRIDPVEALRYE